METKCCRLTRFSSSECVPQRKLDEARVWRVVLQVTSSRDLSTVGAYACVAGVGKSRGVEKVEDVGAKIELLFAEGTEALENRHIHALIAGSGDYIAATAQITDCRCRIGYVRPNRQWVCAAAWIPWIGKGARVVPIGVILHRGRATCARPFGRCPTGREWVAGEDGAFIFATGRRVDAAWANGEVIACLSCECRIG